MVRLTMLLSLGAVLLSGAGSALLPPSDYTPGLFAGSVGSEETNEHDLVTEPLCGATADAVKYTIVVHVSPPTDVITLRLRYWSEDVDGGFAATETDWMGRCLDDKFEVVGASVADQADYVIYFDTLRSIR